MPTRRGVCAVAGAAGAVLIAAFSGFVLGDDGGAGQVSGEVRFSGAPPAVEKVQITKDKECCGESIDLETAIVSADGKVANVVITLDAGKEVKSKEAKGRLANKGCRFVPHVQAVQVGGEVDVVNDDPILHNSHVYLAGNTVANIALPGQGDKAEVKLRKVGVYSVKCDAGHTWMSAYIVAAPNPWFAVTGADGKFAIKGVPAGKYKAKAWHERFGEKEAEVTVTASGEAKADFEFSEKK